jgi:anaerobic ribonucleoside-triphosphate reductase activating protein
MYYADIKKYDVANGPGVRISLFVSGCTHHCEGCFNEAAWDFKYGNPYTEKQTEEIIDFMKNDFISGITVLGGEPFEYVNQQGILPLLKKVRETYPEKSIWVFSGYLFDKDIIGNMIKQYDVTKELLSYIDVIVDGKFELKNKSLSLKFRGSSNQRIINVKESMKKNKVILMEEFMN